LHSNDSKLEQHGYTHFWVNHSIEFVDAIQKFIHTQNIERTWRSLRNSISSVKRTLSPAIIKGYLDTFILKSQLNAERSNDPTFF
jgi:hypothetical protein